MMLIPFAIATKFLKVLLFEALCEGFSVKISLTNNLTIFFCSRDSTKIPKSTLTLLGFKAVYVQDMSVNMLSHYIFSLPNNYDSAIRRSITAEGVITSLQRHYVRHGTDKYLCKAFSLRASH